MPKRVLGGGIEQRLAQLEEEEGEQEGDSKLARELLSMWSWGTMSAPLVQTLAHAACQDGLEHPDVQKLARIGGAGKYPGNMQRDLAIMCGSFTTLQAVDTDIPIRIKKNKTGHVMKLKFLLPHKLFSALYHFLPQAFENSILGGDAANVRKFWATMHNHPVVVARPQLRAKDLGKLVPLGLHGDGVSYMQTRRAGGKSMDALSWTSLLSSGQTRVTNFLMFVLVKSVAKDWGLDQTWPKVWRILCRSMEALASGVWPMRNWDNQEFPEDTLDYEKRGTALADGYAAMVFVLKADLEFLSNHFHLNSPSSNSPCTLCKADRDMGSRPWTFFKMAGAGLDLVYPDLMHCKHLGTDQLLLGSVLSWMVKQYLKGPGSRVRGTPAPIEGKRDSSALELLIGSLVRAP